MTDVHPEMRLNLYVGYGLSSADGWVGFGSYRMADTWQIDSRYELGVSRAIPPLQKVDPGWKWAIGYLSSPGRATRQDVYQVSWVICDLARRGRGVSFAGVCIVAVTDNAKTAEAFKGVPPTRGIAIHWLWFVGAATMLAGVRWRRYFILRRRRSRGCCVACGYDLRAATGDVCSECGVTRNI